MKRYSENHQLDISLLIIEIVGLKLLQNVSTTVSTAFTKPNFHNVCLMFENVMNYCLSTSSFNLYCHMFSDENVQGRCRENHEVNQGLLRLKLVQSRMQQSLWESLKLLVLHHFITYVRPLVPSSKHHSQFTFVQANWFLVPAIDQMQRLHLPHTSNASAAKTQKTMDLAAWFLQNRVKYLAQI